MLDPEHYDAGIETDPHKPFIVIADGEATAREIAERAAAVLRVGNGVGIDFADLDEAAQVAARAGRRGKSWLLFQIVAALMMAPSPRKSVTEIHGHAPGEVIIDEFGDFWPDSLPEITSDHILMPERTYRLIQEMNDPLYRKKVTLEPRQTKPWVHKRDWEGRERRKGGRRR